MDTNEEETVFEPQQAKEMPLEHYGNDFSVRLMGVVEAIQERGKALASRVSESPGPMPTDDRIPKCLEQAMQAREAYLMALDRERARLAVRQEQAEEVWSQIRGLVRAAIGEAVELNGGEDDARRSQRARLAKLKAEMDLVTRSVGGED